MSRFIITLCLTLLVALAGMAFAGSSAPIRYDTNSVTLSTPIAGDMVYIASNGTNAFFCLAGTNSTGAKNWGCLSFPTNTTLLNHATPAAVQFNATATAVPALIFNGTKRAPWDKFGVSGF